MIKTLIRLGACPGWFEPSLDAKPKYCKVPKYWDARNFCCKLPIFKQRGQTLRVFCQNGANGTANSEDPDQTAPLGAV